jgi:hypothetical protein
MTIGWRLLTAVALLAGAAELAGADVVRRYALVAGANQGGHDRPILRYAVSDAARFATVLQELGGVEERDTILLDQPTVGALENALATLRARTESDRRDPARAPRRTEFLFYYSGHADEKGLLLGEDRYSYRSLRDQMDAVPADVRIAVLDACASGAITRLKGGRRRPPFLADESSDMRGHAFLTSSSEDEVAQESEGLGGSFFTHYLTSGLRGAADVSGEGKVTLNEAYQFAFHETLGGTTDTRGGAQHPAYDIQLSGTGDVVMTDVRQTTASLVLSEGLTGRCFVRNSDQQLLVELQKPQGRRVQLGLEPGAYRVHAEGAQVVVGPDHMAATERQETVARGISEHPPGPRPLDGRNRIDLRWTISTGGGASSVSTPGAYVETSVTGFGGGLDYYRWFREDWALAFNASGRAVDARTYAGLPGTGTEATTISSLLVGVRWTPAKNPTASVRPYLTGLVGPYIGTGTSTSAGLPGARVQTKVQAAPGVYLGGGVDFRIGGHFLLGVGIGADLPANFSEELGGTKNYRTFQMNVSFGWAWGKGRPSGDSLRTVTAELSPSFETPGSSPRRGCRGQPPGPAPDPGPRPRAGVVSTGRAAASTPLPGRFGCRAPRGHATAAVRSRGWRG